MCYTNCPYENYDGDCTRGSRIPADGYCQDDMMPDPEPEEWICPPDEDNALDD